VGFLLRKVRANLWYSAIEHSSESLPADPIADITTSLGNALSLWYVHDDHSNLEDVVLALAANTTAVSNLDTAIIDATVISSGGFELQPTRGNTPVMDAAEDHRDIVGLKASDLVTIGELFAAHADFDRRYTRRQIRELIAAAIRDKRLNPSDLDNNIRQHLRDRGLL